MLHPFFDSRTYPWHYLEARDLHKILYQSITAEAEIDRIRLSCSPEILPFAKGPANQMWSELLANIAIAGELRAFDQHMRLQSLPHVKSALDNLSALVAISSYKGPLNEIFVNRHSLRKALEQMSNPGASRNVLVVRGEPGSGKTWSKLMVQHNAYVLDDACIYLGVGTVTTPKEALDHIFMELGGAVPEQTTTDAAWYRQAAFAMMKTAKENGITNRVWIIMDDLGIDDDGAPKLDAGICTLFDQLAAFTSTPSFTKWFRLVLIAYPNTPLPQAWQMNAIEDTASIRDIDEDTISGYLLECAKRKQRSLGDGQAMSLAKGVLSNCPIDVMDINQTRLLLGRIHQQLTTVVEKL